jgi:hypothetical protein
LVAVSPSNVYQLGEERFATAKYRNASARTKLKTPRDPERRSVYKGGIATSDEVPAATSHDFRVLVTIALPAKL